MTTGELLALVIVLLFALYGLAHAAVKLAGLLLRPGIQRLHLVLPLHGSAQDAEQQIRYIRRLRQQLVIGGMEPPFTVLDMGLDADARRLTALLLAENGDSLSDVTAFEAALQV